MIRKFFVLLCMMMSASTFAGGVGSWDGGGAQAGNGRSVTKGMTVQVYNHLSDYIDLALTKGSSQFSSGETELLGKFRHLVRLERHKKTRLHFASAYKFQISPNEFYIMSTAERVGSNLWINSDYLTDGLGDFQRPIEMKATIAGLLLLGLAEHFEAADRANVYPGLEKFVQILSDTP